MIICINSRFSTPIVLQLKRNHTWSILDTLLARLFNAISLHSTEKQLVDFISLSQFHIDNKSFSMHGQHGIGNIFFQMSSKEKGCFKAYRVCMIQTSS